MVKFNHKPFVIYMDQPTAPAIQFRPPQNQNEYIDMVERFSGLVDKEMKKTESEENPGRIHAIALRLPALISLVNTIGYLRGQDGVFLNIRPEDMHGSGIQGYLYKNEDEFEKRLQNLIDEVGTSEEANFYRETLERYYITARTARAS
jgi:hypothetical protein